MRQEIDTRTTKFIRLTARLRTKAKEEEDEEIIKDE